MWNSKILEQTQGRCLGCRPCDGSGCIGQMPGWGGWNQNANFLANVESWNNVVAPLSSQKEITIALAPITGAVQNVGVADERTFYHNLVEAAVYAHIPVCIGDGVPDCKLKFGLEALAAHAVKGTVFIKPYINPIFFERITWATPHAQTIGIDIDSWRIVTMQGQAAMEKKTATQLAAIQKQIPSNVQFAIKGVCDDYSVSIIKELRPDIAVISNHGGRVEAPENGTAWLLQRYATELAPYVRELWVDGGIRNIQHVQKAAALGASRVLVGRPFIQGMLANGKTGIQTVLAEDFAPTKTI